MTTIADIAEQAGASMPAALAPDELVSFRLRRDGAAVFTLASGKTVNAVAVDDPAMRDAALRTRQVEMMANLAALVPGQRIEAGKTYFRRGIQVGDDKHAVIFTEAGR